MGNFFVDNPPPQYSSGSQPSDPRMQTSQQGGTGNFFDNNPPPAPGTPPPAQGAAPTPQGSQGGDPHAEFMQAVQALGIDPKSFRGNPAVMDKVTQYLSQKYPGQNWSNGGQKAGDWVSVNGQGFDVLPAGDANWQWLSDPASGQGGGNPNDPSGFQTGTFTGGGQYPLASVMGTGLAQPWTTPFQAPDPNTFTNQAPFQWQMDQGVNAVTRGLAKNGTLLTGGAMKDLDKYGQGVASQYYGDAYNRALGEYQQAYGIFNNNQGNLFNRLGNLGTVGENAAAGTGSLYQDVGNAQATGSNAQGNIWGNALNNGANTASQLYYLNQQRNQNPYNANSSGYNANGVNGYGVTMTNPDQG